MKFLVVLFIGSCGLNLAQVEGQGRDKAIELLNECKAKTKAKEDVVDIIDNNHMPTSPEGKCMMHCVLETKGLMTGNKANTKGFAEYFEKIYATDPAKLENAAKAVAACSVKKNGWAGLDKCEIASRIIQCGADNNVQLA